MFSMYDGEGEEAAPAAEEGGTVEEPASEEAGTDEAAPASEETAEGAGE